MEHLTIGYHTVEDREDPQFVEDNAPFKCKSENAWVSDGYYFWEKDIKRAHDWGIHACGPQNYIIAKVKLFLTNLFDLIGDREHQEEIQEIEKKLVKMYSIKIGEWNLS